MSPHSGKPYDRLTSKYKVETTQNETVYLPPPPRYATLHLAIIRREPLGNIKLLIRSGAKVNVLDHERKTPLYYACSREADLAIVQELILSGAYIHTRNRRDGRTPLDVSFKNNDILKLVVRLTVLRTYEEDYEDAIYSSLTNPGVNFRKVYPYLLKCAAELDEIASDYVLPKLSLYHFLSIKHFNDTLHSKQAMNDLNDALIDRLLDTTNYPIYHEDILTPNFKSHLHKFGNESILRKLNNVKVFTIPYKPGTKLKRILHSKNCSNAIFTYLNNEDLLNLLSAFH